MSAVSVTSIDRKRLRVALIEHDLPAWKLASKLDISPSVFSAILCGHRRMPAGLPARIERMLEVAPGSLTVEVPLPKR